MGRGGVRRGWPKEEMNCTATLLTACWIICYFRPNSVLQSPPHLLEQLSSYHHKAFSLSFSNPGIIAVNSMQKIDFQLVIGPTMPLTLNLHRFFSLQSWQSLLKEVPLCNLVLVSSDVYTRAQSKSHKKRIWSTKGKIKGCWSSAHNTFCYLNRWPFQNVTVYNSTQALYLWQNYFHVHSPFIVDMAEVLVLW